MTTQWSKRRLILISSTNRGADRRAFDYYATPIPAIEKLLTIEDFSNVKTILDPGAGCGNFSKVISKNLGGGLYRFCRD